MSARPYLLAATVALTAGTLTVGLPAAPTHAVDWTEPHVHTADNSGLNDVQIVSTGEGDAIAAWLDDDTGAYRIRTSTAVDGVWSAPVYVTPADVEIGNISLETNDAGDAVLAWLQESGDSWRVAAARRTGQGPWGPPVHLSGPGAELRPPAVAIDGDRTVHVAYAAEVAGDDELHVRTWEHGQAATDTMLADELATAPSLDVNGAGEAVVGFLLNEFADSVHAAQYDPGSGTWTPAEQVSFLGQAAANPSVGIDGNGRSTVAFSAKNGDVFRIQAATENEAGTGFLPPAAISSPALTGVLPSIGVDAVGRTLVAWRSITDAEQHQVGYASRMGTGSAWAPAKSFALVDPSAFYVRPDVRVGDTGVQTIDYVVAGGRTTQYRTSPIKSFTALPHGPGYYSQQHWYTDLDVDDTGGVALLELWDPPEGFDQIRSRFLDLSGPTTPLGAPGPTTLGTTVPLSWVATDVLSDITGTDVLVSTAEWNSTAFSEPQPAIVDDPESPATFGGLPGTTYCFTARSRDAADNTGPLSGQRCTTLPVDDPALAGKAWTRAQQKGNYLDTVSTTKKHGAKLTLGGVRARTLRLVIRRSATGGRAVVRFNKVTLKTVGFKGTGKKRVVTLATFGKVRSGKVTIRVVSKDGQRVAVDGLVVAK